VEAHGSFAHAHCINAACAKPYGAADVKGATLWQNQQRNNHSVAAHTATILSGEIPLCTACGGYIKPDIVFFGESLPDRYKTLTAVVCISVSLCSVRSTTGAGLQAV
jgi:NAD-dependent SIR2 family protein deacetylase